MIKKKLVTLTILTAMSIFALTGCGDKKEKEIKDGNKITTEASIDTPDEIIDDEEENDVTYSSSKEVITAFFEANSTIDKDLMTSCFYPYGENVENVVEANITNASAISSYTEFKIDEITFEEDDTVDIDEVIKTYNYKKYDDAQYYTVTVPLVQTIEGVTYNVDDIYSCYTICYDDNWYLVEVKEIDVKVNPVGETTEIEDTTEDTTTTETNEVSKVDGLSTIYADLDNRSFAINGKIYTLGETTLQDMIDDGVPFNEKDIANATNNINPNYESSGFRIELGEWNSAQVYVGNYTDENKIMSECPICEIYFPISLDKDGNDKIQFAFPLEVTEEELIANSGQPTEDMKEYISDDGDYISHTYEYKADSEKYIGDSGYQFEFTNGVLRYFYMDLK